MPTVNRSINPNSYLALGKARCQLICLVAKLYKFLDYDGKAYALARDHLTADRYGRAFDALVDLYVKPPNSAWRQMPPRLRRALLARSKRLRDALRLRELRLDPTDYAGIVFFFDEFKRLVRELMPEMRLTHSRHVRRTMINEDDVYWRKRFKQPRKTNTRGVSASG